MIYYLAPLSDTPSWGLAILYNHVHMLQANGINACIVKEGPQRSPAWMEIKVPFCTVGNFRQEVCATDTVIVPEVMINFEGLKKIKARKILFLQAGCFLFLNMPAAETHLSLGFYHVWIIMPHMKAIVEKHLLLPYSMIPPFVAPYFFAENVSAVRKKQVLMFPKFQQIDYSLVKHIVLQHINKNNQPFIKNLFNGSNWQIKELQNLSHQQVATEMKRSAFFVSLNVFEALNTAVIEAMAAGCVVFCYEGFGPRDYLMNNENAIVFKNNEAYQLAEQVCEWIDHYGTSQLQVKSIQQKAVATASAYSQSATQKALLRFFEKAK